MGLQKPFEMLVTSFEKQKLAPPSDYQELVNLSLMNADSCS